MSEPEKSSPDDESVLGTAWADSMATGEGRSIMACIGYARSEEKIKRTFTEEFDDWFAIGCEMKKCAVRNEHTTYLWSEAALATIETIEKRGGWVDARSWIHVNFS